MFRKCCNNCRYYNISDDKDIQEFWKNIVKSNCVYRFAHHNVKTIGVFSPILMCGLRDSDSRGIGMPMGLDRVLTRVCVHCDSFKTSIQRITYANYNPMLLNIC